MKEIITVLTLLLVVALSGCGEEEVNPFTAPEEGFQLTETDTLDFTYNNGLEETELFSYQFANTYYLYKDAETETNETHYDFTNINDYRLMSDDFKTFIESFDMIKLVKTSSTINSDLELSKGATDSSYNYDKLTVYTSTEVYASIVTTNGVQMRISYSIFDTNKGEFYVPSYIVIETVELHESIHFNFLNPTNEYNNNHAAIVDFKTSLIVLPPRTAYEQEFLTEKETDLSEGDYFTQITSINAGMLGEYDVCSTEDQIECFDKITYGVFAQVYESTEQEVIDFYVDNFRGNYEGETFYFIVNGETFKITNIEETQIQDSANNVLTVVNINIEFY